MFGGEVKGRGGWRINRLNISVYSMWEKETMACICTGERGLDTEVRGC